ncbi:MAG: ROK family transcriptional regulator [Rhizobiales bacterium]|nr:ROK family transcriptional regulator [Hyphomicrobiales bacterium]MBI3672890.1 ROK family transcriptional regulator [Hyphomicrobiales bacterium]
MLALSGCRTGLPGKGGAAQVASGTDISAVERAQGKALSRGTTQTGVRLYNERLALSLIRQHGSLPKAEIARLTGLSAQTVSVIVRQLEADGLLVRLKPQRGKVGQPLVPFALDPDGAYSIGLKVGRRSGDLMLMDLTGAVRRTVHRPYRFPAPRELLAFVRSGLDQLVADLKPKQRQRILGLGIAAPFELWNWEEEVHAPHEVMAAWRGVDLAAEIARLCDWPVTLCNDASAACAAELLFGKGRDYRDFAYFYIGFFVGGGIVIDGHLHQGRTGNAGALGSFPVPTPGGGGQQLLRTASFYVLEQELARQGRDPDMLWRNADDWSGVGPALDRWIETAATGLAQASAGVAAVTEPAAMVIDGSMPPDVRARLAAAVRAALAKINLQGITPFNVYEGAIGADARAMGAASLPLFANFIIDRDVLFKETQ